MASMHTLPFAVVLVGVLIAACTDVWRFRLHNVLTIPLFISGLMYHGFTEGRSGLAGAVLGALVGGLPFLVVYAKGGMGAGDIKLLAAVGAWLGPWPVLHVLIVSGLATGCYSAGISGWSQWQRGRKDASPRQGTIEDREPGPVGLDTDGPRPNDLVPGGHSTSPGESVPDVTAVLCRSDRRWNAVPFGAMVAVGVIVTAIWLG